MTIDEQIAVLQAMKEGKKIEAKPHRYDEPWHEWTGDVNFTRYDYRIVREPRRFIIFKWGGDTLYAVPYGSYVPENGKIICTATEDEQVKMADLSRWCEDEAAKLVAYAKTVGTTPA